jgi:hypothetical protein
MNVTSSSFEYVKRMEVMPSSVVFGKYSYQTAE